MSQPEHSSLLSANVAQAVERMLSVPSETKCWFESHYRHISLRRPGS